ncbi:MAG: four helix bundle protein [Anaerolineae bacterium]|nr:four helix bundle protein [Anaerolineae bacterium]NIN94456.1 four helix bundle protein [Anaerolineae bacterium]NIQ77524.1 four helix bundle protein [Anaerolineae bacterium]
MAQYRGYKGNATQTYRKLHGYKNLLAWQAADELAVLVHSIVIRFEPRYYKLTNQMLGSASSVKANIAEGYCRNALGDYIRFCEIARGSLGELGSQIQDCERWGLVKAGQLQNLIRLYGDASYFLENLIKGLRTKRKEGTWDRSMGVKEETPDYIAEDADVPFTLPDS